MLKSYIVKYWTIDGKLVGVPVSALSPIDAENIAKDMPNFRTLAGFPQEV